MSAYMVSDKQISVLVAYMIRQKIGYYVNGWVYVTSVNAEEVGQILIDENYRSVSCRYQDRTESHFGKAPTYKFNAKHGPLPNAIVMLKLCNNFAYQACETDDWKDSVAFKIVEAIKERAITKLPGYDSAPWGID
jgi:hypothetical protein